MRPSSLRCLSLVGLILLIVAGALTTPAKEIPAALPDPDDSPGAKDKPVKVYILSGQSNMVGMGDIRGGSSRVGNKQVSDATVSVYEGEYSATVDYDAATPIKEEKLETFGGNRPPELPVGGVRVIRGQIAMKPGGVYRFSPGHGGSTHNIMEIDGTEVHRYEPGKDRVHHDFKMEEGKAYPFKITFLTKDASALMWAGRQDIPGTLEAVVRREGKFPHLIDDEGAWTSRNDVVYKGVISDRHHGPLTPATQRDNTIGPELQFGHILGHYHDEPVLLIKASIGNRSMGWDILPPGSERYTFEGRVYAGYKDTPASWVEGEEKKTVNWHAGKQYDAYTEAIHDVLDNFDENFPQWKGQDYEIAGFAWWQGHKDSGSKAHINRYEQNLANLIKAWRKEFKAPNAPFVIATIGFDGWEMNEKYKAIADAQLALSGDSGKYPEFKGNVLTVETRDFWRGVEESPRNQGYHYNRNAETYLLVGDALGRGMVRLLEGE